VRSEDFDADVLIAGLGPVGAIVAALLSQHGVTSIAVERDVAVYRLPRAAHFDAEIMRVFQQLGLAEHMLGHSRPITAYEFVNAAGDVLMRTVSSTHTSQGWAGGYLFHQPALEEALREKLSRDERVEMALGWSLERFVQDADGVTARLRSGDDERAVRARYLLGCDGANSTVRKALGVKLDDYGFDEPWLVVDTLMPDESGLKPYGVQVCDPKRPTTIMPMSPGRRRWEFMLLPGEDPAAMQDEGRVAALLSPWVGSADVTVVRRAVYRFHGLVAARWREGRVFLLGDAAHQTPPFAGQGMCAGVRDAANLAWKLAMVMQGHAGDALLDTYQAERDPHTRGLIEMAIAMGRVVCVLDEDVAAARDAQMIAARQASGGRDGPLPPMAGLSTGFVHASPRAGTLALQPGARRYDERSGLLDDLLGDSLGQKFWLLTRGAAPASPGAWLGTASLTTDIDDDGALAAWLDGADAVLVRPDRYVFGTGRADELIAACQAALGA
jgi:3-(3-hydroxy-phenyl)propionate hydroxylase